MTEQEIREFAQKIIIEACEQSGFWKIVDDNGMNVKMTLSDKGLYEFTFDFTQKVGTTAIVRYSPQKFIENLVETVQQIKHYSPDKLSVFFAEEGLIETAVLVMLLLPLELLTPFNSINKFALILNNILSTKNLSKTSKQGINEQIDELIQILNSQRVYFISTLKESYYNRLSAPQYVFCDVYDKLLKSWTKAKKLYKQTQKYENSLELVKLALPILDEQFIRDLADEDNYTAQPSTIALKQTAKFLNVPDSKKAERTLRRYLKESRILRKNYTDEDVKKYLENYFEIIAKSTVREEIIENLKNDPK